MENQGIALSREKILNSVWNYDYFGDARTIDTHVKKLRSKLGKMQTISRPSGVWDINLRWMNHEKIAENADRGTFIGLIGFVFLANWCTNNFCWSVIMWRRKKRHCSTFTML